MIDLVLLAQAVAGPQLPARPHFRSDAPCPVESDTSEVVVCGRADDRYRLPRLSQEAKHDGLPKAAMRIGNAALAAEAEQATLAGGQQSERLMVRLKIPVGGNKRH